MAYVAPACYVIIFEVANAQARERLKERLKQYKTFCPVTEHSWAIVTEHSPAEVRDYLSEALEPKDRLFVIRSGTAAAWRNSFGQSHTDWLKKHL